MKKMSLKAKLLLFSGAMTVCCLVIGIVGYKGFKDVLFYNQEFSNMVVPKIVAMMDMKRYADAIDISLLRIRGQQGNIPVIEREMKLINNEITEYEKVEAVYAAIPMLPTGKVLADKFMKFWQDYKKIIQEIETQYRSTDPESNRRMDELLTKELPVVYAGHEHSILELVAFLQGYAKTMVDESATTQKTLEIMLPLMIALGVAVSLIVGIFFARSLVNVLGPMVKALDNQSRSLNQVSQDIASSSQDLSQSTTEQAASLEETASAVEELNAMIQKNSQSVEGAVNAASTSQQKAVEGKSAVERMVSSMGKIGASNTTIMEQVQKSNDQFAGIVKVIEEIGSKTKVINDIVFQTKLLSFNASVEAARAGEHGKGFAVVAEEVGNLAQMSGNAAKEISVLLDDSIQKVHTIVDETRSKMDSLIDEGKRTIEDGVSITQHCGNVLEEIVQNISVVAGLNEEIGMASKEQANGVSEISKAMIQLDQVTHSNATSSEKSADASKSLANDADDLNVIVGDLTAVVYGGRTHDDDSSSVKEEKSSKTRSVPAKKNNVVHLKSAPKDVVKKVISERSSAPQESLGYGTGGSTPDFDDEGFKDV